MLERFSEMYYQYEFKSDMNSIKIDREYIETKIRNYSDSDRKEKRRSIPLLPTDILNIINREHQRCYYCKLLLSDWTLDRLNNNIGH